MLTGTIRDKRGYVRPGMRGLGVDVANQFPSGGVSSNTTMLTPDQQQANALKQQQGQQMQAMANWSQGNCPTGYLQDPSTGYCVLYGTAQTIARQLQSNRSLVFDGPSSYNIPGSGAAGALAVSGPAGQAIINFDPTSTFNANPNSDAAMAAYMPLLTQQAVQTRNYGNAQAKQQAATLVLALPELASYYSGSSPYTATQVGNAQLAAQAAIISGADPTAAARAALADGPYSTTDYQALVTNAIKAQSTITVPSGQGYGGNQYSGIQYPCNPGPGGNGCIPAHTPGSLASDYLPVPQSTSSPQYSAYLAASMQQVPGPPYYSPYDGTPYGGQPAATPMMSAGQISSICHQQVTLSPSDPGYNDAYAACAAQVQLGGTNVPSQYSSTPNSPMALTTYAPDAAPTQYLPAMTQNTPAARISNQTNVVSTTPSASSTPPPTTPLMPPYPAPMPTGTPGFPSAGAGAPIQIINRDPGAPPTAPAVDTSAGISVSSITDWITANPLLAAAAAVGAFMLLRK